MFGAKQLHHAVKSAGLAAFAAVIATSGFSAAFNVAQAAHPQATVTYKVGISLPYLELKELAVGIEHGARVAINQANTSHLVPGVTFTYWALDDTINGQHSGEKDAQNATAFINDSTVIGEVGPLNTSAAKVSEPVYNNAGLTQISPSNTNPDLTNPAKRALYEPNTANNHSPITYFRTCSTDVFQGHSDALYAKKIGAKTVFVTDNQGAYGVGLAGYFKAEAKMIGLKVLGSAELDAKNIVASAQNLAAQIALQKPDLVFFGGEYGAKGGAEILADDLKKDGLTKTTFMGGDGIFANDFIKGSLYGGADGALASNVGRDATTDPNATAFLKAEAALFPGTTPAAYDTYAYDAANVLLRAFAKAVKAGKIKVGDKMATANRLIVAQYVAKTNDYRGATGQVSFDANGDTNSHVFSVYKVVGSGKSAHWVFQAVAPQG